jgi:hypothetical protein
VLALLAEAYRRDGQTAAGLAVLADALDAVHTTGAHCYEAELYRLKGELTLQQSSVQTKQKAKGKGGKVKIPNTQHLTPSTHAEAEACFHKAIEIAQQQQAKSLELSNSHSDFSAGVWRENNFKPPEHKVEEVYPTGKADIPCEGA